MYESQCYPLKLLMKNNQGDIVEFLSSKVMIFLTIFFLTTLLSIINQQYIVYDLRQFVERKYLLIESFRIYIYIYELFFPELSHDYNLMVNFANVVADFSLWKNDKHEQKLQLGKNLFANVAAMDWLFIHKMNK